ncbi:MAG: 3-dehydroquinate synthase [Puniceicoccaceae bacterium]
METLTVELGERSYPIRIGSDVFETLVESIHLNQQRRSGRSCALVVDEGVARAHGALLDEVFPDPPRWTMPSGEWSKSLTRAEELLQFLAESQLDRSSFLIAIGGGVLGDLCGFCAAVFLRGVDYYQIPTTLLGMVDSSVGGKTGVNLPAGKNLVGAFLQPRGVAVWLPFLESLPEREFAAGMAEVIKCGLLADQDLFHLLEKSGAVRAGSPVLETIIARCCRIKATVVGTDEREEASNGGRALLNLGHTFAHAIEATAGYGEYLHGEAVAIGLLMAARFSAENGFTDEKTVERVRGLLSENGLPVRLRSPLDTGKLLESMGRDKKVRQGKLRLVVIDGIGSARLQEVSESFQIRELWREFGASGDC